VVNVAVLVEVAPGADAGIPFVGGADPAPADFLDTLDVEEDEEEEELGGRWSRFHCAASSSDDLGFAVVGTAFRGFLSLSFAARNLAAAAFVALMIFLLLVMVTMVKGEAARDKSLKEFLLTILMASMGTG
jgi:hypothetical protein